MLDVTKPLISIDELRDNNERMKEYIKSKEIGLSEEEIENIMDEKLVSVDEEFNTALSQKSQVQFIIWEEND